MKNTTFSMRTEPGRGCIDMPVKLVSRTELLAILNERMRSNGEEATVSDVIRLRHPDQSGCNWMPDFTSASSSVALLDVFAHARREFNLE